VGSHENWQQPFEAIPVGKGRCMRQGDAIAVLTIGPIGVKVARICEALAVNGLKVGHYDMRFVKPLDAALLHDVFGHYKAIVTIEDGTLIGGMGSAVIEFMSDHGYHCPVKRLGIPDHFIDHGSQMELFKEVGLDMESMKQAILDLEATLRG
jgi:1-deoxy-D-xylulose-5-phosphate synthase